MRHPNQNPGKFFKFRDTSEWDEDAKRDIRIPKIVRGHMVVALEKSDNRRGFVKIVTVTSTQADNVDTDLLVPIAPSPKNRNTKMQLEIANVGFGWSGRLLHRLQLRSYLRVDEVYEVPANVLEPFLWSQTEHVALKQKSYNRLMHFMRNRPEKMLDIRDE